jgi:hypothetical protein
MWHISCTSSSWVRLKVPYISKNGEMPIWKPHALANPHKNQISLRIGDQVIAKDGIETVAVGTAGKVILANGFNWQRYRVQFVNGQELGDLDHRHLEPVGRTARRLAREAKRAAR